MDIFISSRAHAPGNILRRMESATLHCFGGEPLQGEEMP